MSEEQIALEYIAKSLAEVFKKEPEKITYWLCTKNFNFGGASPALLIQKKRAHIVAEFIRNAKEGWIA